MTDPAERLRSRRARDVADLQAAERLISDAWRHDGPRVAPTPGDLEWWYAQAWPAQLPELLRLWYLDGELVGWSWRAGPEEVDWHVARDRPDGEDLTGAILAALVAAEPDVTLRTWAAGYEPARRTALEDHGFAATGERLTQRVRRLSPAPAIDAPEVPPGYVLRSLRGRDEIPGRVEAHRQAFAPSRLTGEKYERVVALPHYRFEDDLVVVAPDGAIVAFAMAWWDPIARIGTLEPVGTHPHHRRLGLARAVTTAALRRWIELGAEWGEVYSETANPAAEALYEAVGFEVLDHHDRFVRLAATASPGRRSDRYPQSN